MHHDFDQSRNVRRDRNGKKCYGYMDYDPKTNFWSTCNVEYLTRQNKSCLKKINGGGDGGESTTTKNPRSTTVPGSYMYWQNLCHNLGIFDLDITQIY